MPTTDEKLDRLEKLMTAMVSILVADRNDRTGEGDGRRSELVLADAGLGLGEIAAITGRKYETVKSTLRRLKSGVGS